MMKTMYVLLCAVLLSAQQNNLSANENFISGLQSQADCNASFTYTTIGLVYSFLNTSASVTDSLIWYFGDGTTSDNHNPDHQYETPGEYVVCLTIYCSDGDSSSTCSTIIIYTQLNTEPSQPDFYIQQNPAHNNLTATFHTTSPLPATVHLTNFFGEQILKMYDGKIFSGETEITADVSTLPAGIYFLVADFHENGTVVKKLCIEH